MIIINNYYLVRAFLPLQEIWIQVIQIYGV